MKWFFIQSLAALLAAFAIGIPIGYLMWRLQYRKVRSFDTSSALVNSDGFGTGQLDAAANRVIEAPSSVVGVLESPSAVGSAVGSPVGSAVGSTSAPSLERLRVEHAAEVGRLRTSLAEREASLEEIRVQLETSRKAIMEHDSRIATFSASPSGTAGIGANITSNVDTEAAAAKLQTLAEQRDAARAGLAKALGEYETRLAALRTENTQELAKLKTDHASALAALNTDSEKRINEIRSERESAAQALRKISTESDQQRSELQARHESALADLRKRAERAEAELTSVRAELESQRAEAARSVGRQAEIDAALAAATKAEGSLAQAVASRNEMQRNLVDTTASLSRINAELSSVRIELATVKTDLATSRTALDTARAAVLAAESTTKSAQSELTTVKSNFTEIRSSNDEHRNNAQTVNAEFFTLKSTYEMLRADHAALQLRHQALVVEERGLRNNASAAAATTETTTATNTVTAQSVASLAGSSAGSLAGSLPVASPSLTSIDPSLTTTKRMPVNLASVDPDGRDGDTDVDDLERIEGIGPRISASLQAVGIRTFRASCRVNRRATP